MPSDIGSSRIPSPPAHERSERGLFEGAKQKMTAAPSPDPSPPRAEGALGPVSVAELLADAWRESRSGTLQLAHGNQEPQLPQLQSAQEPVGIPTHGHQVDTGRAQRRVPAASPIVRRPIATAPVIVSRIASLP